MTNFSMLQEVEKRLVTGDGNKVQNEEGGIEVEEGERAVRKVDK